MSRHSACALAAVETKLGLVPSGLHSQQAAPAPWGDGAPTTAPLPCCHPLHHAHRVMAAVGLNVQRLSLLLPLA